jgi:hypothetical protein
MEKNVPIIIHADEIVANGGPNSLIVGIVELSVIFIKELLGSLLVYVTFVSSLILRYIIL